MPWFLVVFKFPTGHPKRASHMPLFWPSSTPMTRTHSDAPGLDRGYPAIIDNPYRDASWHVGQPQARTKRDRLACFYIYLDFRVSTFFSSTSSCYRHSITSYHESSFHVYVTYPRDSHQNPAGEQSPRTPTHENLSRASDDQNRRWVPCIQDTSPSLQRHHTTRRISAFSFPGARKVRLTSAITKVCPFSQL